MLEQTATAYTGAQASTEVFLIVLISMILGWCIRWAYERFMYEDVYYEDHIHDVVHEGNRTITHDEDVKVRIDEDVVAPAPKVEQAPARVEEPTPQPAYVPPVVPARPVVAQAQQAQVVMMPYKQDDLKIIEGVGPKIEQLLQEGGIDTWLKLAESDPEDIKTLLRAAGDRYRIHDPTTWPEQAQLAVDHQWDELEEYQDALSGGKDLTRIYKNKA